MLINKKGNAEYQGFIYRTTYFFPEGSFSRRKREESGIFFFEEKMKKFPHCENESRKIFEKWKNWSEAFSYFKVKLIIRFNLLLKIL